jgi:hypothetical protein
MERQKDVVNASRHETTPADTAVRRRSMTLRVLTVNVVDEHIVGVAELVGVNI